MEKLFGSVGTKIEAYYCAFGGTDLFIIAGVLDNASAAAFPVALNGCWSWHKQRHGALDPDVAKDSCLSSPGP